MGIALEPDLAPNLKRRSATDRDTSARRSSLLLWRMCEEKGMIDFAPSTNKAVGSDCGIGDWRCKRSHRRVAQWH